MSDIRSEYSPASKYPGSSSHIEPYGATPGAVHNSNDIAFNGPITNYDVDGHQGAGHDPFNDPESG